MSTATTSTLAALNQATIIETLRTHGPMARPELVERTQMSPATISRLTAAMIADGRVVEDGVAPSTGGRPSIMLRYSGASRVVGAVRVEQDGFAAALVDFDGVVIERLFVETAFRTPGTAEPGAGPAPTMRALVNRLSGMAEAMGLPCLAVGIAVPYAVTPDGLMVGSADAAWRGLTLADLVDPALTVPVLIENDANALAIGELYNGVGRDSPHFAAITLADGLGAGIVTNGALYRGSRSTAGEVGYLLLGDLTGAQQASHGDLEARLGTAALGEEAARRGLTQPETEISASEIFALARAGNEIAAAMTTGMLDVLARAVAAISSILDPEYVVLGEGLSDHAELIIPALQSRLDGRIPRVPKLETATLKGDAVLLGAAEMAMRSVTTTAYRAV